MTRETIEADQLRCLDALRMIAMREARAPGLDELWRTLFPESRSRNPSQSARVFLARCFGKNSRDCGGGMVTAYRMAGVELPSVGARWVHR